MSETEHRRITREEVEAAETPEELEKLRVELVIAKNVLLNLQNELSVKLKLEGSYKFPHTKYTKVKSILRITEELLCCCKAKLKKMNKEEHEKRNETLFQLFKDVVREKVGKDKFMLWIQESEARLPDVY